MKKNNSIIAFSFALIFVILACNLPNPQDAGPAVIPPSSTPLPPSATPAILMTATETPLPTPEPPTPTKEVFHSLIPATSIKMGKLVLDVVSADTAVEKRAPYGDSYDINRFERPFLQDMTYVADLDIASFNLAYDEKFFYVSIELVGTNPNNSLGIDYAVEFDIDGDGFGDRVIIARPPYSPNWSTDNVQVLEDTNRDTGGLSGEKAEAPLPGDGYDTVIFDGGRGPDDASPTSTTWIASPKKRQARLCAVSRIIRSKPCMGWTISAVKPSALPAPSRNPNAVRQSNKRERPDGFNPSGRFLEIPASSRTPPAGAPATGGVLISPKF